MKTKKLSKRHFRYLTKQAIKNPMIYIDDFFNYHSSIDCWIRDINMTVNASAYSDMSCVLNIDNGFNCKELITHVELAYVIYKQCGIKKQSDPLQFFKSRADYLNYSFSGKYTHNDKVDPADTISRFFSYQSLSQWYKTLDDLMGYLTIAEVGDNDRFGDKIVVTKELLVRLAQALHDIYKNGGVPLQVSSYFIAQPAEVFEGKMSGSKLEKLINNLIDEQKGKLAEGQENEVACESQTTKIFELQPE